MSEITINTTRSFAPLLPWLRNIMGNTHGIERYFGKRVDQSGDIWAEEESLLPYRAISGPGAWGSDANDEALVWGTDNTFSVPNNDYFGIIRVLVTENSEDTHCLLKFVWHTNSMAEGLTAGQFSVAAIQNITAGSKAGGSPFNIMLPILKLNQDKLWMQVKSGIDDHYVDFIIGVHGYPWRG